jgi:hypothetical protein
MLDIEKALVVNPSHLTEADYHKLIHYTGYYPRIIEHEYGWIIPLTTDPDEYVEDKLQPFKDIGLSESALKVFQLAFSNEVSFLVFDRDGQFIEDFPIFDW